MYVCNQTPCLCCGQELETLNARLEETQNGWAIAQQQVQKLETAFRRMEREKNELIQVA